MHLTGDSHQETGRFTYIRSIWPGLEFSWLEPVDLGSGAPGLVQPRVTVFFTATRSTTGDARASRRGRTRSQVTTRKTVYRDGCSFTPRIPSAAPLGPARGRRDSRVSGGGPTTRYSAYFLFRSSRRSLLPPTQASAPRAHIKRISRLGRRERIKAAQSTAEATPTMSSPSRRGRCLAVHTAALDYVDASPSTFPPHAPMPRYG